MAAKIKVEGALKGAQIMMVPLSEIQFIPGDNSRRYAGDDVSSLADSIKTLGQMQPVGVSRTEDGKLKLEWGYRRYRAVQYINEHLADGESPTLLACVIQNDGQPVADVEAFLRNIAENAARKEPTPIDHAHAVARLCDEFGFSVREAGARLGKSGAWASSTRRLLELPSQIQKKVDAGTVPVAAAYDYLTMPEGPEKDAALSALEGSSAVSRSDMREKIRKARDEGEAQAVAEANTAAPTKPEKGDKKKRTLKELAVIFAAVRERYTSTDDKGEEEVLPPTRIMDELAKLMAGGSEKAFERKLLAILEG